MYSSLVSKYIYVRCGVDLFLADIAPGSVQSNNQRATRVLVPTGERAKKGGTSPSAQRNPEWKVMHPQRGLWGPSRLPNVTPGQQKVASSAKLGSATPDQLMLATPSMLENLTDSCNQSAGQIYQKKSEVMLVDKGLKPSLEESSSQFASQDALLGETFKKEQFYSAGPQLTSQSKRLYLFFDKLNCEVAYMFTYQCTCAGDNIGLTVDSRMDSTLSYLHSVSLTAGDNFPANQGGHDSHVNCQELEIADAAFDMDAKYDASNLSERGIREDRNQNQGEPLTHCSVNGSCVTAVSIHSGPTVQSTQALESNKYASSVQMPESAVESSGGVPSHVPQKQPAVATGVGDWNPDDQQVINSGTCANDKAVSGTCSRLPSEGLSANDQSTSGRDGGGSRANKGEKERHKKSYDLNVFFKVNGKLYQKLGKIGSGGSSEVHKVISAECSIYALKKIKLKGREYPTAYGFCQEIEYLNKLKGKSNIIQLIDYEVLFYHLISRVTLVSISASLFGFLYKGSITSH
jgi:serine/threonine-protein kinase TTK/MPS1